MTKSKAAFLMSAQALFGLGRRVYFWTFTFKNTYPDWWYPAAWRKFALAVYNLYGGDVCGLRVIEAHKEHGLHYHLLVNRRMSIHLIRRIATPLGIFWIHVSKRAVPFAAALYVSKYVTKYGPKLHEGIHRWNTFGAFQAVKKNSVIIDSPYMRARRRWVKTKVPYGYEELLRRVFEVHGCRGLRECARKLREGKLMSAATMASPHLVITPRGGLKYFAPIPIQKQIKVASVKST